MAEENFSFSWMKLITYIFFLFATVLFAAPTNTSSKEESVPEGLNCAFCMEELDLKTRPTKRDMTPNILSPCSHIFHEKCLDSWWESDISQRRCPVCRAQTKGQMSVFETTGLRQRVSVSKILSIVALTLALPPIIAIGVLHSACHYLWGNEESNSFSSSRNRDEED